jgi:hypothetical protein
VKRITVLERRIDPSVLEPASNVAAELIEGARELARLDRHRRLATTRSDRAAAIANDQLWDVVATGATSEPRTVVPLALPAIRTMLIDAIRTMTIEITEISRCLWARLNLPAIPTPAANELCRST